MINNYYGLFRRQERAVRIAPVTDRLGDLQILELSKSLPSFLRRLKRAHLDGIAELELFARREQARVRDEVHGQ